MCLRHIYRRFLHHPEHWGVLACKTRADSSVVWLNRTGTFGIASAAYWFSRLIGLVGRLSFRVLLEAFIFVLIYADDLHLIGAGKDRWLNIWMTLALFCVQGTPFSDHKWRGGLQVDWVGYWIDYTHFRLEISKKRCQWIISSIEGMESSGWLVDVRRFHELHGRLGFMSQVLLWIRPFLAPGYAWLCGSPWCCFVPSESGTLHSAFHCGQTQAGGSDLPIWFGRERPWGDFSHGRCLQLVLSRTEAPWLFKEGGSSWASTSAELLASLVALYLIKRDFPALLTGPGMLRAFFCGGTDNRAAESLSMRLLTTKVPLMFILMQYVDFCDLLGIRCHLSWRPRDTNVEADQITKFSVDGFDASLRLPVSWSELDLPGNPKHLLFFGLVLFAHK